MTLPPSTPRWMPSSPHSQKRSGRCRLQPRAGRSATRILHLALTDEAAALAACDPSGFEAYRDQRRQGTDAFAANRSIPAPQLLDLWRANRQRLLECLRSITPRARITWFGPPMSAMSHATARLMETWAHGQDVVDALGLERPDTSRLKHIAHLGVRTRAYSYAQHDLTPPATDVRVELTGPEVRRGPGVTLPPRTTCEVQPAISAE